MGRRAGQAKINGDWVDLEYVDTEPETGGSFFTNPDIQRGVRTAVGMGVGAYKFARELAGYVPNPAGSKVQQVLPWAAVSAAAFVGAPYLKTMRKPAQLLGALLAGKAIWEFLKREPTNKGATV